MADPPPYEEASHCRVCNCTFTTFKRRHHCRACGRSLCNEHSSNQKALPQFGIYTPVRVCDDCLNPSKARAKPVSPRNIGKAVEDASASIGKMNLSSVGRNEVEAVAAPAPPATPVVECTCGMPLCICEAPAPAPAPAAEMVSPSYSPAMQQVRAKKASPAPPSATPLGRASSYGSRMPSLFFQSGYVSQASSRPSSKSYESSGEGLREAVKAGDVAAVKDLLGRGLDANYVDKQGMSLLHLAAMFNFTDITFMLMDAGADASSKNSQGESPIDCAQTTLGHKMRQRVESSGERLQMRKN